MKIYTDAEIDIMLFDDKDVIATSNGSPEDYIRPVDGKDLPDTW